jgi:hypothetical protein
MISPRVTERRGLPQSAHLSRSAAQSGRSAWQEGQTRI